MNEIQAAKNVQLYKATISPKIIIYIKMHSTLFFCLFQDFNNIAINLSLVVVTV